MATLRNQKGVLLITVYIVVVMMLGLSAAFFIRAVQEGQAGQRQSDEMKALYNAEKAVAYAYFEAGSVTPVWQWYTHSWDASKTPPVLISNNLNSSDAVRTTGANVDCHFITNGTDKGCYAANDGTFIVKSFSDPEAGNITLIRAKGISGNAQRVIEYRISRESIFDYYFWTPYGLNIGSVGGGSSGSAVSLNGGRIHANGDIVMDWQWKKFYGVDTITTGKDRTIYFSWSNYLSPGYYDWNVDGSGKIDGKIPAPDLGNPFRWAGTTATEPYGTQHPWQYEQMPGVWNWRTIQAWYTTANYASTWPPRDWREKDTMFYTNSSWFYPAKKDSKGNLYFDSNGNIIIKPMQQIPAKLDGAMWDWTKYRDYGTIGGQPQQPVSFTVYDQASGGTKPVEDSRWKIVTNANGSKSVVMTGLDDPQGVGYWQMLKSYDYWKALGYSDGNARYYSISGLNQEVLDGTYGSEYSIGQQTIPVDNTNTMQQPQAWNTWLEKSNLDDVFFANERGEDMEPPRFATTYKDKGKKSGLYLARKEGTHTLNYANGTSVTYTISAADACGPCGKRTCPSNGGGEVWDTSYNDAWQDCVEKRIDALAERLNRDANGNLLPDSKRCAAKKKFINTYTSKWNAVLELDLEKMKTAGTFPANGIVYSEVPIRLANANQLPYKNNPNAESFNVISEENVYLKGDYNNPSSGGGSGPGGEGGNQDNTGGWMPSAVITKKYIYTLSKDFNDPQKVPALVTYPSYPAVYVKKDASGNFIEANPSLGDGSWNYYGVYPSSSKPYQDLLNLTNAIQADWENTFAKDDSTGSMEYTVSSSHPLINGKTSGAMPNRALQSHVYNCLMASYYNYGGGAGWRSWWPMLPGAGGVPSGSTLERWGSTRSKNMKGAYFQLDWGEENDLDRFTAHESDGPLDGYFFASFNNRGSYGGSPVWGGTNNVWFPGSTAIAYDGRFRNPLLARNKPIFFGEGGSSSWREIPITSF